MTELLYKALRLAITAHDGQKDKQGKPYILHPLGVWRRLQQAGHDEHVQIAGLLHDVIEDTPVTADQLYEQFSESAALVEIVSRKEEESYDVYIDRVCQSEASIAVKLADIEDNLDPERGPIPDSLRAPLRARYERARRKLRSACADGWI